MSRARDPVGGQIGGGRQRPGLAGDLLPDGETGRGERFDQVPEAGQAGEWLGRQGLVLGLAQHVKELGQFVQDRNSCLVDVAEGDLDLARLGARQVAGDTGLDIDQRDVVGDHVVEFAGDAQAFLGDPAAGLRLQGRFGALGSFVGRGDLAAPGAHAAADGCGLLGLLEPLGVVIGVELPAQPLVGGAGFRES